MLNKRILIILLIPLAIGLFVYWLERPEKLVDEEAQQVTKIVKAIREIDSSDPEAKIKKEKLLKQLPERVKRSYEIGFKAGIEDIAFHGKVEDQNGDPVVGATIRYEAGGRYLAAGSGMGALLTNKEGRFSLDARGGSLIIYEISHPSIIYKFPMKENSEYVGGEAGRIGFLGYQHTEGGNDLIWKEYTADNPYIFKAWKPEKFEELYSGKGQWGILSDGRIYTFDFSKKFKEKIEGEKAGHIQVIFNSKQDQERWEKVDWEFDMWAIDGGLIETDDLYLVEPPENGYQDRIHFEMKLGAPEYKEEVRSKRYYFRANNGTDYGSLVVSIFSPSSPPGRATLRMTYKVNPHGSRNLALKKK